MSDTLALMNRLHELLAASAAKWGQSVDRISLLQDVTAHRVGRSGVLAFVDGYALCGWDPDDRRAMRDAYRLLGERLRDHGPTRHMVFPLNFESVRLTRKLGAQLQGVDADGYVHYLLTYDGYRAAAAKHLGRRCPQHLLPETPMGRKYLTAPLSRLRELFDLRDGKLYRGGKVAGGTRKDGYARVRVDGTYFLQHRVIFALVHGRWPELDVDHKAGVAAGNHPENLREATHADNMRNMKARKDNTSGATGVSWDKSRGKWAVTICCNGRTQHFGRHDDLEFADLVAQEARRKLFGAFAPALD